MSAAKLGPWLLALLCAAPAPAAPPAESARATVARNAHGKPAGPIAVAYELGAEPVAGRPLSVTITARALGGTGWSLDARAFDPAKLLVAQTADEGGADGQQTWTVTVVPLETNAGYLIALVRATVDAVPQARSVLIPVRSAAEPPPLAATVPDAPGPDAGVVLLPAQERP